MLYAKVKKEGRKLGLKNEFRRLFLVRVAFSNCYVSWDVTYGRKKWED